MRSRLSSLHCFFVILLLALPVFAQSTPYDAVVKDDENNVREFGGDDYKNAKILGVLNKSDKVSVVEVQGKWARIQGPGGLKGWVNGACLQVATNQNADNKNASTNAGTQKTDSSIDDNEFRKMMQDSPEFAKANDKINTTWKILKDKLSDSEYSNILREQREWIKNDRTNQVDALMRQGKAKISAYIEVVNSRNQYLESFLQENDNNQKSHKSAPVNSGANNTTTVSQRSREDDASVSIKINEDPGSYNPKCIYLNQTEFPKNIQHFPEGTDLNDLQLMIVRKIKLFKSGKKILIGPFVDPVDGWLLNDHASEIRKFYELELPIQPLKIIQLARRYEAYHESTDKFPTGAILYLKDDSGKYYKCEFALSHRFNKDTNGIIKIDKWSEVDAEEAKSFGPGALFEKPILKYFDVEELWRHIIIPRYEPDKFYFNINSQGELLLKESSSKGRVLLTIKPESQSKIVGTTNAIFVGNNDGIYDNAYYKGYLIFYRTQDNTIYCSYVSVDESPAGIQLRLVSNSKICNIPELKSLLQRRTIKYAAKDGYKIGEFLLVSTNSNDIVGIPIDSSSLYKTKVASGASILKSPPVIFFSDVLDVSVQEDLSFISKSGYIYTLEEISGGGAGAYHFVATNVPLDVKGFNEYWQDAANRFKDHINKSKQRDREIQEEMRQEQLRKEQAIRDEQERRRQQQQASSSGGANCGLWYSQCKSTCVGKSSGSDAVLLSNDKKHCEESCTSVQYFCERGDMNSTKTFFCDAKCAGAKSEFDCRSRCHFELGN